MKNQSDEQKTSSPACYAPASPPSKKRSLVEEEEVVAVGLAVAVLAVAILVAIVPQVVAVTILAVVPQELHYIQIMRMLMQ